MFTSFSVIIPTYNRRDLLMSALAAYLVQSQLHMVHELLVVDDGSTDDTESAVREYARRAPFRVRYLKQRNKGPAAARNYGVREAQSDLVLFTDSDIIPERTLLEQHLEWHNRDPEMNAAVLGYVTWSPELRVTPFMRWYGEDALFAYRRFRGKREISCRYFYTCNLSLKTKYLRSCGQFDEDFKSAAYEDMELGFRLNKQGLRLFYNPNAIAYHHQVFSFEDACRKADKNAEARRIFEQKEAGQHWATWQRKRAATLNFRIARRMAAAVAITLGRCKGLLDSRLPMPPIIYHCVYWYRVNFSSEAKNAVSGE